MNPSSERTVSDLFKGAKTEPFNYLNSVLIAAFGTAWEASAMLGLSSLGSRTFPVVKKQIG